MAKNNKQPKKQEQKPAAKTPKKIPAAPETVETAEAVEAAEVPAVNNAQAVVASITSTGTSGSLDANHRVDLNGQIIKMFHDDPRARQNFGDDLCNAMDDIARCGIICALADEAINGTSTFSAIIKQSEYPALVLVADKMGIKLPPLKALEVKNEEVEIPSTSVSATKEAKKQLKEEHELQEQANAGELELDPVKVAHMGEEDLKKALKYLMIDGPKTHRHINKGLIDSVDFMTQYRMELARQAQNSTEAMNAYSDRTMYEWLKDIFSYIPEPTFLVKGIGLGMRQLVARDKNPLNAFLIFRGALIDKETGVCVWDDKSIADATRAIVELVCKSEIAKEKTHIEELDPKAENYNELKQKFEKSIKNNEEVMDSLINFDFSVCTRYAENWSEPELQRLYGVLMTQYYPLCDCRGPHFKNLNENLVQHAGIILNMFKNAGETNPNYSESNLLEVFVQFPGGEKRTVEEWAAVNPSDRDSMVKAEEQKKALAEKKAQAKNS